MNIFFDSTHYQKRKNTKMAFKLKKKHDGFLYLAWFIIMVGQGTNKATNRKLRSKTRARYRERVRFLPYLYYFV